MKNLTTTIGNSKVILSHVANNTFKLTAENGTFRNGKGANYSTGQSINQAAVNGHEIIITKAEIARLGTYMIYLNGERVNLFTNFTTEDNRTVSIIKTSDIYYYFRKPENKYTLTLYK